MSLKNRAAIAQLVERRGGGRKVTDSRFDPRTGYASLCTWKRHLTLFSIGSKWSTAVVAQTDERPANRTQKGCSAMARQAECAWFMRSIELLNDHMQ